MQRKIFLYCGLSAIYHLATPAWAGEPGLPVTSVAVPAISEWGLLGLATAVGVFGVRYFRARNKRD